MPRNGTVNLANLVVQTVLHAKTGSRVVMANQAKTIQVTVEVSGVFPDDMNPRPDGTVDMRLDYDPR